MAARRQRRTGALRHGEALVARTFGRLGLRKEAQGWRVLAAWSEMVGPSVGRDALAEQLRGTTLYVRVSSSAWASELSFLKAELLAKLRTYSCAAHVTDLRFSVGPLDQVPSWREDAPRAAGRSPRPRAVPDPEVTAALEAALLQVADGELRDALGGLLRSAGAYPDSEPAAPACATASPLDPDPTPRRAR